MTWNYRVVKMPYEGRNEFYYEIKEIYYDENDKINGYANASVPYGDTAEEVKEIIQGMLAAYDEPILNYDDIKGHRL